MRDPICRLPDCGKPKMANAGVCSMHAARKRRYGSFELPPRDLMRDHACEVDGCEDNAQTRGMCRAHYTRWLAHGEPTAGRPIEYRNPQVRFMSYVEKTETCWLWTGTLTYDGYGLFSNAGRRTGAHRFAYEFFVGPIPDGLQVDHVLDKGCTNRHCVRPDHLEPVTALENQRRRSDRQAG